MLNNQVTLIGQVVKRPPIRSYNTPHGRKIFFDLAIRTLGSDGISSYYESHHVAVMDSVTNALATKNSALIAYGQQLYIRGQLHHRYLVDSSLRSIEVTEIVADTIAIHPEDVHVKSCDEGGCDAQG